jgi:hypothetical protein
MAWVNTTFEGRPVDFWNQTKQQGEIRHVETEERVSGPVFGQFTVSLSYSDTSAPVRPREVLEETWTVRVYNVTSSYMFDVLSQQKCVQDMPLKINKYHYGGMALRGPSQWFDPNGSKTNKAITSADDPDQELRSVHFLTSEGKGWFDGNHTNARWVDMYGKVDGRESGVLVMGHPENFRAPQMVRLNPNKPYFCFAPMVTDAFEIKPGDTYTSRYRYWIHTGSPDSNTSDRLWTDYAYPPKARMVDR